MGMLGDMIVRIKADTGQFVSSLQKSERHMKHFVKFIIGGAGLGGAILIFRKFGNAVSGLVKEYEKTEGANQQLLGSIHRLSQGMTDLKRQAGAAIIEFFAPVITKMEILVTRTLQAWSAQRNLNKALKGEATTVEEIDKALEENTRRREEARKKLVGFLAQQGQAQTALDTENKKLLQGVDARTTSAGARAVELAQVNAGIEAAKKEIAAADENAESLARQREELAKLNTVKSANIVLTKAQIEAEAERAETARLLVVKEITDEVERKKALWDEEAQERQALENEMYEAGRERRAKEEAEEAQHTEKVSQMRQALESTSTILLSSLATAQNAYYAGLLDNENLSDKERRKIQRKQAASTKAIGIFEATIHMASAIAEALPNPVLAFLAGAAGAAQIAAIASQPLPKLARGGKLTRPTMVMAGEAGTEWMVPQLRMEELGAEIADALRNATITNVINNDQPIQLGVYLDGKRLDAHIQRSISDRKIIVSKGAVA